MNLRVLSDALMGGCQMLDLVRFANTHRVRKMPERREFRDRDIVAVDFEHCVGSGGSGACSGGKRAE